VILFGRECDTKYVVARSWAAFLSAVADDFEGGEARFADDPVLGRSGELRIRWCYGARDDSFLEVLKARVRLREKEVQRRRELYRRKIMEDKTKGVTSASSELIGSPLGRDENRFPSPSLPRRESPASSPVVIQLASGTTVLEETTEETNENTAVAVLEKDIVPSPVLVDGESGTTGFSESKDGSDSVESHTDIEDGVTGLGTKEEDE